MEKIVIFGKFYFPISNRYPDIPNSKVTCDMCKQEKLKCCIGYDTQDLCLSCADIVVRRLTKTTEEKRPQTKMRQSMFNREDSSDDDEPLTYMRQDKFVPQTRMRTNMFKK